MPWVFDPHSGGLKIPEAVKERVEKRVINLANERFPEKNFRLNFRFRKQFCYIDAFTEPMEPSDALLKITNETKEQYMERLRNTPTHLCRLRYFNENRWSVAFFTYSHEKYEPTMLPNGSFFGTPEECFQIGAIYLEE